MRIAAPKSLAAAPLVLLSAADPRAFELVFFTDHDSALSDLAAGKVDLLCTGYTEMARLADPHVHLLLTHCWGLSAIMVPDAAMTDKAVLFAQDDAELVLPFAGSPLDLQVRALLVAAGVSGLKLRNAALPETFAEFQQAKVTAAVFPEPLAALLESGGKGHRLADLSLLWQQTFGELYTPQVSLFAVRETDDQTNFVAALREAVQRCMEPDEQDVTAIAAQLGIPPLVAANALQHVIFALPAAEEARRLEAAYRKTLYSPLR
ncbi:MAG TPA: hypothetical protein PKD60_13100 [Turneriella sp.]|nr:hypothetical protein [Turneriella sp.]